jgi:hypothetical protein
MDEAQQREIFRRFALALMLALISYGVIGLMGWIKV